MTAKETADIIKGSSLWHVLSLKERLEALSYALKMTGNLLSSEDISTLIGEVYS